MEWSRVQLLPARLRPQDSHLDREDIFLSVPRCPPATVGAGVVLSLKSDPGHDSRAGVVLSLKSDPGHDSRTCFKDDQMLTLICAQLSADRSHKMKEKQTQEAVPDPGRRSH